MNDEAADDRPLVLHVRVVTETGGGPEKTILNSPRHLEQHGYRAKCVYLHPPQDPGFQTLLNRAKEHDAVLIGIPDRGIWDLSVLWKLWRICRQEGVAIWHGHDYKSNVIGLLIRAVYRLKLVTTVHGWVSHNWRTRFYFWIDRLSMRWYQQVICVSPDLRETMIRSGVPETKTELIRNAIVLEDYQRTCSPKEARVNLGFAADIPVIGSVGRLSQEKGFDSLITAVSQLHNEGINCQCILVGEGPQRTNLEQLISQQSHPERYYLVGHQVDVRPWLETMDVFVSSSRREGLANVLLEAVAMEVPIVATELPGTQLVVEHQRTGLLVPVGDHRQLAGAIAEYLRDDTFRRQLAEQALQEVREHWSFSGRMEKVVAIYDHLMNSQSFTRKNTIQPTNEPIDASIS
ncbi:glycosyltransferase [Calycomorphotria hydatis]|uniref:Alpha-D-kanosaminyltransferase n=1 Tax=Calycomorphotria hydatis TaxID=2528027 RepID=A0A517T4L0_9PLAN|nr:glycosyltransferase [Calycomorphotria hydatis]QDT63298.1 Alpha-D-kanosaminyltransferase [Calycomorphotria hydatis]